MITEGVHPYLFASLDLRPRYHSQKGLLRKRGVLRITPCLDDIDEWLAFGTSTDHIPNDLIIFCAKHYEPVIRVLCHAAMHVLEERTLVHLGVLHQDLGKVVCDIGIRGNLESHESSVIKEVWMSLCLYSDCQTGVT